MYHRMLSTDERVELLYDVVHSIIRAFGLQQTLAKRERERERGRMVEWFRDLERHITSSSYHHSNHITLMLQYPISKDIKPPKHIKLRWHPLQRDKCGQPRRLSTIVIVHVSSFVDQLCLSVSSQVCFIYFSPKPKPGPFEPELNTTGPIR